MKNTALQEVTKYIIHNNEWVIVYCEAGFKNDTEDRHYAGIRREWITDGKLNREVNGMDILISHNVAEVIDRITDREEMEHLIANGMTIEEAIRTYFSQKFGKNIQTA